MPKLRSQIKHTTVNRDHSRLQIKQPKVVFLDRVLFSFDTIQQG